MDTLTLAEKQAQFDEFFMIAHEINVNIKPLPVGSTLPSMSELEEAMPYAFRIASEMSAIEAQALRPLRNLGEQASGLADYLNHQARKIDLMMSYILHQQDEQRYRLRATKFGGGGVIVRSTDAIDIGASAELKLFLTEEAAAIFCFGEVIACQKEADDYHIAFIFNRIREEDQELLVRASLHLQTQQLRKRAQGKDH
ncbi:PilZ domain-containing protein [Alteromonas pelagimontana]|uniref:PilZ domain-containing protein n=1 Tax=Alteromonas pelagimontana TaxID=1858656 RepID=A0A6M4M8P2_9ALTE|nr:PilZ domain-containing protein [Alteromonas pelagimontana]QJR79507.1 PilZ domain-containing protein [Alteromonas pelagimontana]